MRYQRLLKNSKAISPIFATLILIAIAVIAGVVVYMFTSGTLATMTSGGVAGQEKVAVQGVTLSNTVPGGLTVYAQSLNSLQVTVSSIVIKNTNGDIIWSGVPNVTTLPSTGAVTALSNSTAITGITTGNPYTITVVSTKGGSFVSASVVCG